MYCIHLILISSTIITTVIINISISIFFILKQNIHIVPNKTRIIILVIVYNADNNNDNSNTGRK